MFNFYVKDINHLETSSVIMTKNALLALFSDKGRYLEYT